MIMRINLFITYECNKNCYYCDIPKRERKGPDVSLIEKYLKTIDKGDFESYTLTGGEPGMVSLYNLEHVFKIIVHPVKVNTNGLFISNGYLDKYYDQITEVGYHPSIDPKDDIDVEVLDKKVVIYQPITKETYKDIDDQLRRYPNVQFNYIPYIRKMIFTGDEKYYMDREDLKKCQEIICRHLNVTLGSRYRIKNLSTMSDSHYYDARKLCQNSGSRYVVNFVDGLIHRCPESITHADNIPLNESSINLMLNEKLFTFNQEIYDVACQDCYYFPTFTKNNIESKIRERRNNKLL